MTWHRMLLDVSGSKYKNRIEKIPQTSKIFKKNYESEFCMYLHFFSKTTWYKEQTDYKIYTCIPLKKIIKLHFFK